MGKTKAYPSRNRRNWRSRRLRVFIRDNWTCIKCGLVVPEQYRHMPPVKGTPAQFRLTVDHIIPKVKGGAKKNTSNLQAMCSRCNLLKGDSLPGTTSTEALDA